MTNSGCWPHRSAVSTPATVSAVGVLPLPPETWRDLRELCALCEMAPQETIGWLVRAALRAYREARV